LSLHFHEAGDRGRAWHYSLAAAERARQRFATETAADFYERALANATHLPEVGGGEIARVAELLGDACETVAKYERATRAYTQARRLREDSLAQSGLLRKEGVLRERTARYVEALRWYGRARRLAHLATGTEAQTQRASIDLAAAGVRFRQGRYAEGVRLCESAVAIAERLGDTRQRATAYFLLDLGYTYLQRPESADYRGRALPIYEEIGDLVGQARTLNNLGAVAYFEGRWDEALERFAEYRERSERAGDIVNAATAMNNIGEILSDQGRVGDAVELFREARRIWRATGYTIGVALATCNLGRAEARLGAHEVALAQLHEGEAAFEAIGVPEFVALAQAWRSECLLFAGRPAEALEVAGRLVERGRGGVDDHAVGAVAHRTMALAFLRLDKPAEAQAALEIARRESAGTPYEVAHTLLAVAALEDGPGGRRGDEARNEALDILERLGAASARLHE
jgi:tetratricopeptide (TPR) repeat protein